MATDELPQPLVPADCDLRGYEFMPLFGHRLFASDFYARAGDLEFRVSMRLWWSAWQQCPAGSLPDDDAALCRFADLGRDMRTWRKIKATVLHGFVKCADGRFYHPLLCHEAIEAYARRKRDRDRKARMRDGKRVGQDADVHRMSHGTSGGLSVGQDADVPRPVRVLSALTGQDRTEERKEAASTPNSRAIVEPTPATPIMPARDDPPHRWLHLGDKREIDEAGVTRSVVAGFYIDQAAELVCTAARINAPSWRGDWRPLMAWLRDGFELPDIVATVERVASRPGYAPPGSLAYFDKAVRERGVRVSA